MRSPVKSWKNVNERRVGPRRSYNGWTRRVTWYEGPPNDIRLRFEDEEGKINAYYTDKAKAQQDFDAFSRGELSTATVRQKG